MAKVVEIPGVGNVEFPDSMGDDEISKHAQKLYGSAEFDKTKAKLEAQPPMSMMDKAKALGGMVAAPITGIPGALGELKDWVAGGFVPPVQKPDGRLGPPDYMTENPVSDITGGTVAAVLAARPGSPKAAAQESAPPGGSSPGLFSTIRTLYNAYKTIKKATPTAIAEKGFETFLDHLEGKTPEPPKPSAPQAPTVTPIDAPRVRSPYSSNAAIRPPLAEPNPPLPEQPAPQPRGGPVRPPLAGDSPAAESITKATIKPEAQPFAQELYDSLKERGALPTDPPEDLSPKAYEAVARSGKGGRVAKYLYDQRYTPESVRKQITVPQWKELFKALGENEPGASSGDPTSTIQQAQVILKKLYDAEKPAATPKPNIRRRK